MVEMIFRMSVSSRDVAEGASASWGVRPIPNLEIVFGVTRSHLKQAARYSGAMRDE